MLDRLLPFFLAALMFSGFAQNQPPRPGPQPHHDGRTRELSFPGPGHERPEPDDVTEVKIGYFGPSDADHPLAGDLWLAAQLAVAQANSAGGYSGIPFRLLPAWSDNPWEAGIAQVIRLIYNDQVWALIGGIDGPSTHLVEQVTAKARLALVSGATTDKSVNFAYVPWMFSLLPSDSMQAPILAEAIRAAVRPEKNGGVDHQGAAEEDNQVTRLSVISTTDHDPQLAVVEFKRSLAQRRVVISSHVQIPGGAARIAESVGQVTKAKTGVVLVVADAADSGRIVQRLREEGCEARIFGSATMGRRAFLETAGLASEGVVFPLLVESSDPAFTALFASQFGRLPDYAAIQTYDATKLLIRAIQAGGLNRAKIRDAIRGLSPWQGSAGEVKWDAVGQNSRTPGLGTIRDGRVIAVDPD
jgi:branched-chain amino acid transport system substrate-binding protein